MRAPTNLVKRKSNLGQESFLKVLGILKALPHNDDGADAPSEISSDETKFLRAVTPARRNFVKYDGIYASICAVKASAVHCAVMP
ncbi:MAG: hypothetical protein MJ192_06865 [Clostridia bacterium]|nr:hypothetical protein [Clostridia bacterium]